MEVMCQLIIAKDLNMICESDYLKLRRDVEEISNKINSLRNYQLNNLTNKRINK